MISKLEAKKGDSPERPEEGRREYTAIGRLPARLQDKAFDNPSGKTAVFKGFTSLIRLSDSHYILIPP